jgi:hypothetical protein
MRTIRIWAARVLWTLAAVTLVSCGSLRTTYLANGTKGYAIACRGLLNTWDSCLVKAGRICGTRGYDIIEGDKYDRSLLIGCKAPATTATR